MTPLLVYAQRQLLTRIQKFNGPDIAQQACARYEADNGQKVICTISQAAVGSCYHTYKRGRFRSPNKQYFHLGVLCPDPQMLWTACSCSALSRYNKSEVKAFSTRNECPSQGWHTPEKHWEQYFNPRVVFRGLLSVCFCYWLAPHTFPIGILLFVLDKISYSSRMTHDLLYSRGWTWTPES